MKILFLASAFLAAPALAQTPVPATPASAPTFDWKLRLTKGQRWAQAVTIKTRSALTPTDPRTKKVTSLETNLTQHFAVKYEVLDATPTFYLLRSTYTAFDQNVNVKINGKTPADKAPIPDVSKAYVGSSFTIKQAPDGRILDVTGLEDLVARQGKMMDSFFKTPQERAAFKNLLPSAAALKSMISQTQSLSLPRAPLAVGGSYSYNVSIPVTFLGGTAFEGKRTLVSLDGQKATFDESISLSTSANKPSVIGKTKSYSALSGTISGQSVADVPSGRVLSGALTTKISGKITVVQGNGKRLSLPITATSQTTISTTP